jgi:hypothetical protein
MQIEAENRMARLEEKVVTMANGMTSSTRIVLDHDQHIDNLERNHLRSNC